MARTLGALRRHVQASPLPWSALRIQGRKERAGLRSHPIIVGQIDKNDCLARGVPTGWRFEISPRKTSALVNASPRPVPRTRSHTKSPITTLATIE